MANEHSICSQSISDHLVHCVFVFTALHKVIEGKCADGENLSVKTAQYTDGFVKTWYSCIQPDMQLCHFSCLQDPSEELSDLSVAECCAAVSDAAVPVMMTKPPRSRV